MKKILVTTLACLTAAYAHATIVFTAVSADDNDSFTWTSLTNIASGTTVTFTDNAWTGSALNTNEGNLTWDSGSTLTAGTMVTFNGSSWSNGTFGSSGSFNAAGSGDNILAYTGTSLSPTFLGGIGWANSTPWAGNGSSTNDSAIPAAISGSIITLGTDDNYLYNGPTSGDSSTLLAAVQDASNWTGNNTTEFAYAGADFSVIPEPSTYATIAGSAVLLLAFIRRRRIAAK